MEELDQRKDHLKWRKLITRILEELLYEEENKKHNYAFIHEHFGRYFTSVEYPTFVKYKNDARNLTVSEVPDHILTGLLAMRYRFKNGTVDGFEREHARELKKLRRALAGKHVSGQ